MAQSLVRFAPEETARQMVDLYNRALERPLLDRNDPDALSQIAA